MADQHQEKRTTVRFPPEEKAGAVKTLRAAGWGLNDYLIACIRLLAAYKDPKDFLSTLAQYRPPERRGRPKKAAQDQPSSRGKNRP